MMEPGDPGPPSIPIQVADAPLYWVGWTAGTVHSALTLLKVDPVAIWPDQFVDICAENRLATCDPGAVTKWSGLVWGCDGEAGSPWPHAAQACDATTLLCSACAPATEAPMTR